MLEMPRRSVTRFFIPLIDVLILLFCIFLLMPIVEEGGTGPAPPGSKKLTPGEAKALRQQLDRWKARVDKLERERPPPPDKLQQQYDALKKEFDEFKKTLAERIIARTFFIDDKTGELVYYNPDRKVVHNQAEALGLVERDRVAVPGNRQLYYLIIAPRDPDSGFPRDDQRRQIEGWFKNVPLAWDFPKRGPGGGKNP